MTKHDLADYSLTGASRRAVEQGGLVAPVWFRPAVNAMDVKALMKKSDWIAGRDVAIWLGLMAAFGWAGVLLWPTWWSVPMWVAYGVLYGSGADSRWHECGHRTAFRSRWLNTIVFQLASFMMMRNPYVWRASHVRHHTDTIIVGRDPEIVAMRPPDLVRVGLNAFGILDVPNAFARMVVHAAGRLSADEADYVRDADRARVARIARIWLAIYGAVVGAALAMGSILPLMLVGLPRMYGAWHHVMTGVLQHLGLAENVTDHRLNTRTVLMNPVSRFIALNMNYHLEHHLFTMVPYYNLPKLRLLVADQLPAPERSIWAAYRRVWPVLRQQLKDQAAVIVPDLPEGATPYGPQVEALRAHAV